MRGPNARAGRPRPRRSELSTHGITTLLRLKDQVVATIPRALVRQLGLVPGQLVSFTDVGDNRLLLRKVTVEVHGTDDVSAY